MSVRYGTGPQACGDLSRGAAQEWLLPEGVGGYAMGTASGLRSRRYHGLLVVAREVPGRRMLGLASLVVVLRLPGGGVRLSTHEWQDVTVASDGHRHLVEFVLEDGTARWSVAGRLDRARARPRGRARGDGVAVRHRLVAADGPVEVEVEALCTWRDVHGERTAADGALSVEHLPDGAVIEGSYRLPGPWLAARWRLVDGGAPPRGASARPDRGRGPVAGRQLLLPAAPCGDSLDVQAWAGRVIPHRATGWWRPRQRDLGVRRANAGEAAARPAPTMCRSPRSTAAVADPAEGPSTASTCPLG